jgi:hypothetical protein
MFPPSSSDVKRLILQGLKAEGRALSIAATSFALCVSANAQETRQTRYATLAGSEIVITDLGLLPGGTSSGGLAINDGPTISAWRRTVI